MLDTEPPDLAGALDVVRAQRDGEDLVIFTGSAVSKAAPAGLPIVTQFYDILCDEIVRYAGNRGNLRKLRRKMTSRQVQFESLMQTIDDVLSDSVSWFGSRLLIAVYGQGSPNSNHRFVGNLLVQREILLLLTTNFDELVEHTHTGIRSVVTETQFEELAAELSRGGALIPTVAHLHGAVSDQTSLVAFMRQVGKPIHGARRTVLEQILGTTTVVLVGYSGSDQDIAPVLAQFPETHRVQLVKATGKTLPSRTYPVELDPLNSRADGATTVIRAELARLSKPDMEKLIGAVALSAGMSLEAGRWLTRGLRRESTESAALAYGESQGEAYLFSRAVSALTRTPEESSRLWARWVGTRAFYLRQRGRIREAASEHARVRASLESQLDSRVDSATVGDFARAALHEIEAKLLLASALSGKERSAIVASCADLLTRVEQWSDVAAELPPMPDVLFYHAEIALMRGDASLAERYYREYTERARHWLGPEIDAFILLRVTVARCARGTTASRRQALGAWIDGVNRARAIGSLMLVVQYFVALPILAGLDVTWYWRMRRIATRVYPAYGIAKFACWRLAELVEDTALF